MRRRVRYAAYVAAVVVAVVALAFLVPLPARLSTVDSRVIFFRDGSVAYAFASSDGKWRLPVAVERLDPRYIDALLRYEDHRFFHHPGVDPLALVRALWQNVKSGRRTSGASTLTMQLVRMLEPRPRTLTSKLIEAARAVQLELRLSKREILTDYLRFLPYGGNLEGVQTASQRFFGHDAHALSTSEILTLLAIPQEPRKRAPQRHDATLLRAMSHVGTRLDVSPLVPLTVATDRVHHFAQLAPHAAFWLRARHPDELELHTTLDRSTQLLAERILRARRGPLGEAGIWNGAVVVVDHRAAEVRALVGNVDFWDVDHHGQIAGFATPRSPGSTLKPLLYAQALDLGAVSPELLLEDVPQRWGGWTPSNYDGSYRGLVRAEEALSRSLNTVFLRLLSDVGVETFVALLSRLELRRAALSSRSVGLSLILGAVEVTPLELTAAYAALADGGVYRRPRILRDEPPPVGVRVFSPGASWLTARALAQKGRPDSPARQANPTAAAVFWKTGTSFGQRDAWSVGAAGEFTVGVWLGNFDRRPSPALVGSQAAGPILFDVLDALRTAPEPVAPPPADLQVVQVCAYSGYLPGPACDHTKEVLATRAPPKVCPFHASVEVDARTGQRVSNRCDQRHAARRTKRVHALVLPAEVARVFTRTDGDSDDEHELSWAQGCQPLAAPPSTPVITSPAAHETLVYVDGVLHQTVPLEVSGVAARSAVRWFVDGKWVATARGGQRAFWQPAPGDHEIVVEDWSQGKRTQATRRVHVDAF